MTEPDIAHTVKEIFGARVVYVISSMLLRVFIIKL